jgi:hypothetical protein
MANRFVKILASLLAGILGCSSSSSSQGAGDTPNPDSVPPEKLGAFEFVVPTGWTKENAGGGLLLMAPDIENNWQANLFLELREDADGRTLEQGLADLIPNLKNRNKQFHEVSRKVEKHSGGFQMGKIEYTCADQGTTLTEWEIIVEVDSRKRLFVLASSASGSWTKYQPVFQSFVGSLRESGA